MKSHHPGGTQARSLTRLTLGITFILILLFKNILDWLSSWFGVWYFKLYMLYSRDASYQRVDLKLIYIIC